MLSQQRIAVAFLAILAIICTVYLTQDVSQPLYLLGALHSSVNESDSKNDLVKGDSAAGFDTHDLRALCDNTDWKDGLWLRCHSYCGVDHTSICGGLNNARNRIQTCLRLAIDAGSGLIIPTATTRDEQNLLQTDNGTVCPDVYWDIDYLGQAVREQCPQLQLRSCGNSSGIDTILESPRRNYLSAAHHNGTFKEFIDSILESSNITAVDSLSPVAIDYGDPYIGWNYAESGELSTIRKDLFKIVRFNRHLLNISSQILQSPQLRHGFIGVHLRGESDWPASFGSADTQMQLYTSELEKIQDTISYEFKTVYVSCGDEAVIQRFREQLLPLGYTVHDKWTLLAEQPELLAYLDGLTFDEKGIVEYQMLVSARFWMGILTSSMSALIAYARSADEHEDFFMTYIFPGSLRNGLHRNYPEGSTMKGDKYTKLMTVNGVDIMDAFP